MDVNQAEPLAEVSAAFAAYEEALMANDVDALDGFFPLRAYAQLTIYRDAMK